MNPIPEEAKMPSDMEWQILKALGVENGEQYVDTKAKFLVEDLLPIISQAGRAARLKELELLLEDYGTEDNVEPIQKRIAELRHDHNSPFIAKIDSDFWRWAKSSATKSEKELR